MFVNSDVKQDSFSFGKNWQKFIQTVDKEKLEIAEMSLTDFMSVSDLKGRSFLDIGSGSGIFSYAAHALGAARVVSFDLDPFSVECSMKMREAAGCPDNWQVMEGSVLDRHFLQGIGKFDVVYSWGVLHHTGQMWEAIKNSCEIVDEGGSYYIALYNKILARDGSQSWIHDFWLKVKRLYNRRPVVGRCVLEPLALGAYLGMLMAKGKNPITHISEYKAHRGMSWRRDATDWLGGYPYEFATVEEVFKFITGAFPDFTLVNLRVTSGRGLNWYLFKNRRTT
jgi:SAM-dependent methyltransferase